MIELKKSEGVWHAPQLLLLIVSAAGAGFAIRAIGPLQETMRAALAMSDNQMALLQGPAMALPAVLLAIPLGLTIDRYSRARLLLVFSLFQVAGNFLTALTSHFVVILFARCLVGLSASVITMTVFAMIADLYAPERRGRAKGMVVVGQYAGTAAAFGLGGVLVAMFNSTDSWRWAMFWLTAPLLLATFSTAALAEPPRSRVATDAPPLRDVFCVLRSNRAVIVPLTVGVALADVPLYALTAWAAPTLSRSFNLASDQVGAIMAAAVMVSGVFGPIVGGTMADLCHRTAGPPRTLLVLVCFASLGVFGGFFAVMPSIPSASVLLVLCCTTNAISAAMGVTLFTIVVPNEIRGLCLMVLGGATGLIAFASAPVAVSVLSGAIGGPMMIGKSLTIICVFGSALSATMFLIARQKMTRSAETDCGTYRHVAESRRHV